MDATLVYTIVGLLAPVLVGIVANVTTSSIIKAGLMFVIAALVGAVSAWQAGAFGGDIGVAILAVYGAAQTFYWAIIKPTGFNVWLLDHFFTAKQTA